MTYEEVLLEVLCFDFDIRYPHTYLADIIATFDPYTSDPNTNSLIDCAWSVAHDSYRTPLCILYSPQVIAAAAFLFAQCLAEGPVGPTLTERVHSPRPNDIDWRQILGLSEEDISSVAGMFIFSYFKGIVVDSIDSCSNNTVPILWLSRPQRQDQTRCLII